ncbi:MAG: hypothetical protein AB8H80_06335 [Planctomycetota bacterium]
MGCPHAPHWPYYHELIPPHRSPGARPGYRPGRAHALPVVLVQYQCTGWLLLPVTITGVQTNGYVIDQAEYVCRP